MTVVNRRFFNLLGSLYLFKDLCDLDGPIWYFFIFYTHLNIDDFSKLVISL